MERMEVQASLDKKVCKFPSQRKKVGVVACHPSHGGKCKIGSSQSRLAWAKSETLISKINRKRVGGVAQAVELLSSEWEALSSNPQYS
jgi:hypothetical protein